ncbi:hypothetical protein PN442_14525, partial [Dolichospermum circinale CS-547]|nr:hypothetical protein [Dolichospermum circinale CS-547]
QVKNISPILKEMHEFKEKIRKIFNNTNDWYTGVFKLGMWLSRAKKYGSSVIFMENLVQNH